MFNKKICIDLGTSNTRVTVLGEGLVYEEPTVISVATKTKEILAIGSEAKLMLGKVSSDITAEKPLKAGVIANYRLTEQYLNHCISYSLGGSIPRVFKPEILISVPVGVTSVEERAVIEAALSAGAHKVYLLSEPIAAALGAGMPINSSEGHMIVNIGGGTTEIAIVSVNSICTFKSEKFAGDYINNKISSFIRKKYNVIIGDQLAEHIKINIGSSLPLTNPYEIEFRGREVNSGIPTVLRINSNDIVEGIEPVLHQIGRSISEVLMKSPPELASAVIDKGLVITGGSAELRTIDEYLTRDVGIPAHIGSDPSHCVIHGLEIAFENLNEFRRVIKVG